MGKGSWSRRRHMTEASMGCVIIIHEEADDWRMHIPWGEKSMVWCTSRGGERHIWCGSFQVRNVVAEPEDCCALSAHKAKRGRLKM
ncbi:hypothetical protein F2Q69_00009411 [Brassica cretica]|uniref:Uncharacterized protein n=1 Tax=Brassica cretica TaxID=69181 RepID=A0A8S9NWZ9_BRACR|nr:hypothetical protein F2Q69_00009411 [Brassica cretica]